MLKTKEKRNRFIWEPGEITVTYPDENKSSKPKKVQPTFDFSDSKPSPPKPEKPSKPVNKSKEALRNALDILKSLIEDDDDSEKSKFAKAGDADDCGHETPGPKGGKFTPGNTCSAGGGTPEQQHGEQRGEPSETTKRFEPIYQKAPEAKKEVDHIASTIAEEVNHGSHVITAPVKSKARALQKIKEFYKGDIHKVKDLARNTIVADNHLHEKIIKHLSANGAELWEFKPDEDPLGYSGVNASLKTRLESTEKYK